MGSKPRAPQSKRPSQAGQPRGSRQGTRALNRSEERAMRVRAAATAAAQIAASDDVPSGAARPTLSASGDRVRRGVTSRAQSVGRIVNLTRDQEYTIIRGDLRRLLVISAVLLVAMVALLLVLPS